MKRIIIVVFLVIFLGGALYARTPGDMLLGLELGIGGGWMGEITDISGFPYSYYSMLNAFIPPQYISENLVDVTGGTLNLFAGVAFNYYLFSWLSFSTGLGFNIFSSTIAYDLDVADLSSDTLNLSYFYERGHIRFPLAAHINFAVLSAGLGFAMNFLVYENYTYDATLRIEGVRLFYQKGDLDYEAKSFLEFYIDGGLDFTRDKNHGIRLLARYAPALSVTFPADKYGIILNDLR